MEETQEAEETAADGEGRDTDDDTGGDRNTDRDTGGKRDSDTGEESTEDRRLMAVDTEETAADDREDYTELDDQLALYEWLGGLAAGLGFFMTPLLTGPFAGYCALKLRRAKPVTALLLVAIVIATAVFWLLVLLFIIPA